MLLIRPGRVLIVTVIVSVWMAVAASAAQAPATEAQLRAAITAEPPRPGAFVNLSRFLEKQKRVAEATTVLETGLAKLPGSSALHEEIAYLYAGQGKTSLAAEHFETALKFNPSSADLRHNVALARF